MKKLRQKFKIFSDHTCCHGFHQLYYAKRLHWKLFWLITLSLAFGVTAYHITEAVEHYVNGSTDTLITLPHEKEMFYPPLRMCYANWLFWTDSQKIRSMNYDREAVFYGLSYAYRVFSSTNFDTKDAKDKFFQILSKNNFTTLIQFYNSISRDFEMKISESDKYIKFDKLEIVVIQKMAFMCYKMTSNALYKIFHDRQMVFHQKELTFDVHIESYENFKSLVNEEEYVSYMKCLIEEYTHYTIEDNKVGELINYEPRIYLYPNAFDKTPIKIMFENDGYIVDLQGSSYVWQNKRHKPCLKNQRSFASANETCRLECENRKYKSVCKCQPVKNFIAINEDQVKKLCPQDMVFLTKNETGQKQTDADDYLVEQFCEFNSSILFEFQKCLNECVGPCEIWKYEHVVSITQSTSLLRKVGKKNVTNIVISYPPASGIVIMTETDSRTFESFVANVGGLLGIWMGASVISLIQMVYLCCVKDNCDDE